MQAQYTDGTPVAEGDFVRYHQAPGGLLSPEANADGSVKWRYGVAVKNPRNVQRRVQLEAFNAEQGYLALDPDELYLYGKGGWLNAEGYSYFMIAGGHIVERWAGPVTIAERLDYLRGEIRAERISYGGIADLQELAEHIAPDDVELREWAGLPEDEPVYFCTYCDYYSRRWDGKREPGSEVYTGTRREVVAHAEIHPIGDPDEMALPIAERGAYEGEA